MLHFVVAARPVVSDVGFASDAVVASGETVVFEGPWMLGPPIVAQLHAAAMEKIRVSIGELQGFALEALAEPDAGEAFVIGAHRMRDPERFRPYAEQVAAVVARFGGRFLARGGKVTPLGGAFVPDRAVIIEFATAADAVAFYISDLYAPLLEIRHATTDPRLVVMARAGALPAAARAKAESYLRSRAASSH